MRATFITLAIEDGADPDVLVARCPQLTVLR
jgi:hypothetical protein